MSRHRDQGAREIAVGGDPGRVEPPTNRAHSRFRISRTFLLPLPGLDYAPLSAQSKPIPVGSVVADKPFRGRLMPHGNLRPRRGPVLCAGCRSASTLSPLRTAHAATATL